MEKLRPTTIQKRFLIIWVLFHSFALFVNLADIRGAIDISDTIDANAPIIDKNYYDGTLYLFTRGSAQSPSDFWPFTSYYETYKYEYRKVPTHYIGGIFNSYGLPEYAFYIIGGFLIVFVPKLWKKD